MSALVGFLTRIADRLIAIIGFLVKALSVTWATLAVYYSNLPWAWARLALAAAFALFAVWGLWPSRRRSMSAVVAALFFGIVGWWIAIPPSNDRHWRPEVAVMPRASSTATVCGSPACAISTIARATISRCATKSARCSCHT
ncbi:hypothetical protein [Bradyrhizobium viridifuturi]|uniref:hypothetical protein n=1 Tax=Bradyrhizobium viridifuturi TaxID=1654716 RepID=UPI001FCD1F3A|nr:hypothetical protein [Bradyrhizobium viridifuturi]